MNGNIGTHDYEDDEVKDTIECSDDNQNMISIRTMRVRFSQPKLANGRARTRVNNGISLIGTMCVPLKDSSQQRSYPEAVNDNAEGVEKDLKFFRVENPVVEGKPLTVRECSRD